MHAAAGLTEGHGRESAQRASPSATALSGGLRGGGAHLDMERNSPPPPMFMSMLALRPELRRSDLAIRPTLFS
jgi:hypothetical protein